MRDLQPIKKFAKLHLGFLSGKKNSKEVFQIYKDSDQCKTTPHFLIGTLDQHFNELVRLNRAGCAIAVVVNETDLKGRATENIIKVRALFTDDDNNLNKLIELDPPSFVVRSKAGLHKYYMFRGLELHDFHDMQKLLAFEAETDPKVCDLGRPMRLAGFYHMKDPSNPFLVTIDSQFMNELEREINE